jgi:hypothetical protein
MIDLNQFLTVGGLATFLLLLTQALKTYVPKVDAQYIPFATLGLGVLLGEGFAASTAHLTTSQDWVSYGVGGLIAGFTAIGGYEATLDKILKNPPTTVTLTTGSSVRVPNAGSSLGSSPIPPPSQPGGGININQGPSTATVTSGDPLRIEFQPPVPNAQTDQTPRG